MIKKVTDKRNNIASSGLRSYLRSMTPAQCRAGRALLAWTQRELAEAAGVSDVTVRKFEGDRRSPHAGSLELLRQAFERAGVVMIEADSDGGAGVRFVQPRS